ncbi:MAG: hypothetical protein ACKVIH_00010 [Burkholderiales bacterium]
MRKPAGDLTQTLAPTLAHTPAHMVGHMEAHTAALRQTCAAFVLVAALGWWVAFVDPRWLGSAYLAWHGALTLLMLRAWQLSQHAPLAAQRITLTASALAWLLVLGLPVFTTHDAERYLWDGAVALAGLDPYRLAPDAAPVAALRAIWPTPAEHTAYPTLYPPGALALFALAAAAGPQVGPWVWKLLACTAGFATVLLVRSLLARRGSLQHLPLVALSPLLLLESGVGAHVDAVSALALVAALWCLELGKTRWAGIWGGLFLGLGGLLKLAPVLAWLALAAPRGWPRRAQLTLGLLLALAVGYGLALALGLRPVGSLGVFFEKWRFGSPVVSALGYLLAPRAALLASAALALVWLALAAWRARSAPLSGLQWVLAAPLLFSPVVFPWYLCLLVPLIALQPRAWLLAWVSVVPLSYEVLNRFAGEGVWAPAAWPLLAIAAAWLFGAVVDGWILRGGKHGR